MFNLRDDSSGDAVLVSSTSSRTADVSPYDLREPTAFTRLRFEPVLVDNPTSPDNGVEGRIVYERKKKADELFPSELHNQLTKGSIRQGDSLELSLNSAETRALYEALGELYQLRKDIGGIPAGIRSFVQVDGALKSLYGFLRDDPSAARLLSNSDTFSLVKELLKLLTQGRTHEELNKLLSELEDASLNRLSTGITLERLERAVGEMDDNLDNDSEQFWQSELLEKYPWVISQLFSAPCVMFESKAYVGGKSISDRGGNVVDFLYQNSLTKNVALVEIKTPKTRLLGGCYRNHSFSLSRDLSGAVNQVLSYKQSLLNSVGNLQRESTSRFEAFSPRCLVIIGSLEELRNERGEMDSDMLSSFENFRNSLAGVTVVTYDELILRIRDLIQILSSKDLPDDHSAREDGPVGAQSQADEVPF